MDFTDYSSFPILASPACSPTTEAYSYPAFDKAYIAGPYTSSSDASLAGLDTYFDRPISSVEAPKGFTAKSPVTPTTTAAQLKAPFNPMFDQPFGQIEPFSSGFSFDANTASFDFSSPSSHHSRTPSLCGDVPQDTAPLTSPPLSPRPQLKRESTDSSFKLDSAPSPKRKRGRPRVDRANSSTSTSSKGQHRTPRLPHNQVERKYREGLNASLERLRRAVPTLVQPDEVSLLSQPRPSKSMVLAGAIDYIKAIEKERDLLREENERLRTWGDASGNLRGGASSFAGFLPTNTRT
ncbi:hypothetical protein N0V90_005849 [Kalmusia sp. IMI 367209]|nr:hypothetical protein N0V90_005849 [Kalmusia sp. IMI 367209]